MAKQARGSAAPRADRAVVETGEFTAWTQTIDAELRDRVAGAAARVASDGPTKGRPHVERIHGSRLAKLKEVRIDRGTRVLFAFDSRGDAVMLVGGDKSGQWNRWYPQNIERAERLYADHERSLGKEPPRCLSRSDARRTPSPPSR